MLTRRYLIVNADDFGQSHGVNRGIIQAHESGIVTSASLMVRWPEAGEAAAYSLHHPDLSVGLHFDLGEWTYRDGSWAPVYEVAPVEDRTAVADECFRQLADFRRLVGQDPTHLDSHQHVHLREPVHSVLAETGQKLGVPVRHYSPAVHYRGDFYGQTATGSPMPELITVDSLISILANLPHGLTELGCHPGDGHDLCTMYRGERTDEMMALCDPRVRAAVAAAGIKLRSFRNVGAVL